MAPIVFWAVASIQCRMIALREFFSMGYAPTARLFGSSGVAPTKSVQVVSHWPAPTVRSFGESEELMGLPFGL